MERSPVAGLRLILVTPEKTLFDRAIKSARLPMFDGSAGFYPGRAPLVGRLGMGELAFIADDGSRESWLIDSGFVQVKGELVSVLTQSAVPASELSRKIANEELEQARQLAMVTDEEFAAATRKLNRARQMLRMADKD